MQHQSTLENHRKSNALSNDRPMIYEATSDTQMPNSSVYGSINKFESPNNLKMKSKKL